jgi:dinuclear metal center YbgI/SA1388 family protein
MPKLTKSKSIKKPKVLELSVPAIERVELDAYLQDYLDVARFSDYCPNGLQVEGRTHIRRVVSGVTACQALIQAAIQCDADAILVHHGYFWRGEDPSVVGMKQQRLKSLLSNDLNLFAFHLPLDAHPDVGNNAALGRLLGLPLGAKVCKRFGDKDLGWITSLPKAVTAQSFAQMLGKKLNRAPLLLGPPDKPVRTVAWCTGGAQSYFESAIQAGADLFLSGEVSEQTYHCAVESQVAYVAAGHHATERYGVQALGEHLAERFGIEHRFIDIDNPV